MYSMISEKFISTVMTVVKTRFQAGYDLDTDYATEAAAPEKIQFEQLIFKNIFANGKVPYLTKN